MEKLKQLNLKALLERSARLFASNPALTTIDGEIISYALLYNRVQAISRFLKNQGIASGDKVALISENMPNWVIAYFSVTAMGAVIVPILPDFHVNEMLHIIRHSKSKAVFASVRFVDAILENENNLLQTVIRLDDFKRVVRSPKKDLLQDILKKGEKEITRITQAALQAAGLSEKQKTVPVELTDENTAAIIYTSGTTGLSKGVMLSHKNIVFDALASGCVVELSGKDRLLSILPLAHTYECTLGMIIPIMSGSCVYYLSKPPTPTILAKALTKVKPTIMLSVPLVIEKIFKMRIQPEFQKNKLISSLYKWPFVRKRLHKIAGKKMMKLFGNELYFFGIGGAALAPEVEQFLIEAGFPYAIGYGLTETAPLVAGFAPQNHRFRSTGPAIEGVEIKIHQPDAHTGEGEIWVRGANVMQGYYKDPDRTQEALTEDGWFKTGDLGYLDKDGYLFIKGRSKNMIVGSSGENIYPEQIEARLNEFDCVVESLVFSDRDQLKARVHLDYEKLDERFGINGMTEKEVQLKKQDLLEDIRERLNEKVSSFSRIQKIIEQPEPFVKTPTQKIKRYLYLNNETIN